MNEEFRISDIERAEFALQKIGITMIDSNGGYLPFNKVMVELGSKFKELRSTLGEREFQLIQHSILQGLCGVRIKNEFTH